MIVDPGGRFCDQRVDFAHRRIVFRYGHPGVPGSEPGYLHNPDDALLTPGGAILAADIKNCRVVVIRPPAQHVTHQLGETGNCTHELGVSYGSPNGAFPMTGGDTVVTEINGDWIDVLGREGRPITDTHPPGFSYPSDTNELRPGVFLSADYTRARVRSRRSQRPAGCCGATNPRAQTRSISPRWRCRCQTGTCWPTTTRTIA